MRKLEIIINETKKKQQNYHAFIYHFNNEQTKMNFHNIPCFTRKSLILALEIRLL